MTAIDGSAKASARNEDIVVMKVPPGVRAHDLIRRDKDFRALPGKRPD